MESPEIAFDVVVIALESIAVVANVALVETCKRYEIAEAEAFHDMVGLVEIPAALLAGLARVGAKGALCVVVNERTAE